MRFEYGFLLIFVASVLAKQVMVKKDACIYTGPTMANKCSAQARKGFVYNVSGSVGKFYKLSTNRYIEMASVADYKKKAGSLFDNFKLGKNEKAKSHSNTTPEAATDNADKPTPKAAESSPRPSIGKETVYYAQGDPRWGDVVYTSTNDKSQTIRSSGCGPTSMAMAVATLADPTVVPTVLAEYAVQKGYRTPNDGTAWAFFCDAAAKYGLNCKQTETTNDVVKALQENKNTLVVASMGPGYYTNGGHFILLHGTDGKELFSHDPAKCSREKATIELFKKENSAYFIISKK